MGLEAMSRGVPAYRWRPLLRALLLVAILAAGYLLLRMTPLGDYLTEERIIGSLMEIRSTPWAPGALLVLYIVLAPLGGPMMVLIVIGSVFGPVAGAVYNVTGMMLGAVSSYWTARLLGREVVTQFTGDRFRRAEKLLHRHGFWPLVQTRFLPLPFVAVNYGAALAGVNARRFFTASAVGLIPSTAIHSFFISHLIYAQGAERIEYGIGYLLVFVAFNLLIGIPWTWSMIKRRTRYRSVVESRANRAQTPDR